MFQNVAEYPKITAVVKTTKLVCNKLLQTYKHQKLSAKTIVVSEILFLLVLFFSYLFTRSFFIYFHDDFFVKKHKKVLRFCSSVFSFFAFWC